MPAFSIYSASKPEVMSCRTLYIEMYRVTKKIPPEKYVLWGDACVISPLPRVFSAIRSERLSDRTLRTDEGTAKCGRALNRRTDLQIKTSKAHYMVQIVILSSDAMKAFLREKSRRIPTFTWSGDQSFRLQVKLRHEISFSSKLPETF